MFSSIRARIVALCVAIVVVAPAANAVLSYVLDEMDQQNAALVEESTAAAAALQSQVVSLASAVKQFKLD